ncbi:MAG: RDD family protein [Candidatus Dormibacteria bacterium]
MTSQPPTGGPGDQPTTPPAPAPPQAPTSLSETGPPRAAPPAGWRPPGPAPGLVYAGFGWRFLGYILDIIILFVVEAPIAIPFVYVPFAQYYRDHPAPAGHAAAALPADLSNRFLVLGLLGALVSALYFGGLVAWQGRTLGQRAMGAVVVRAEDGGSLPPGRAYLRASIFWAPGVLGVLPVVGTVAGLVALIGLLSAAWDQRRQGWHDKLARSLVVKRVAT